MGHENRGRPQLHPGSLGFDVGPGAVMRAARTCAGLLPLLRATCSYQDGARTEFQRTPEFLFLLKSVRLSHPPCDLRLWFLGRGLLHHPQFTSLPTLGEIVQ